MRGGQRHSFGSLSQALKLTTAVRKRKRYLYIGMEMGEFRGRCVHVAPKCQEKFRFVGEGAVISANEK